MWSKPPCLFRYHLNFKPVSYTLIHDFQLILFLGWEESYFKIPIKKARRIDHALLKICHWRICSFGKMKWRSPTIEIFCDLLLYEDPLPEGNPRYNCYFLLSIWVHFELRNTQVPGHSCKRLLLTESFEEKTHPKFESSKLGRPSSNLGHNFWM